jgi:ubiquinone/menaquinone biosynthesis C-methylase UbiE
MSYDKSQATREFEKWSESYDRCILQRLLFAPSHRAILKRIAWGFGDRPIRLLDVGCGTGVFAARARASLPNATVWGIDLVAGMIRQGGPRWDAHSERVQPIQADSERLPFDDRGFDVVTCSNSFHHYPHQDRAVAEMHRVLKPGGRLMLVDGYRDAPYGWFIYDVCVAGVEGQVHHCSRLRMRKLFAAAGFVETIQIVHRGFAPFLLTEGVAKGASGIYRPNIRASSKRSTSALV